MPDYTLVLTKKGRNYRDFLERRLRTENTPYDDYLAYNILDFIDTYPGELNEQGVENELKQRPASWREKDIRKRIRLLFEGKFIDRVENA